MKEYCLEPDQELQKNQPRLVIGQSAIENTELVKQAKQPPNDPNTTWWFHLESVPSAHIVAFDTPDPKCYLSLIKDLLLLHTKKAPSSQHVIYTLVKNVKTTDTPGLVLPGKTKKF